MLPGSQRARGSLPTCKAAAPVLCRTCTLGAYLHGPVARGKHSSLLSIYAIPQQLLSITCLRAPAWRACARRGKVCKIPSLPRGPACPAPAARRVLHLALGRPPCLPRSILLLPWLLWSALEPVVAPHHEPVGSGVHAAPRGECQAAYAGCPAVARGDAGACPMGACQTLQGAALLQGWILCPAAGTGANVGLWLGRAVGKRHWEKLV